MQTENCPLRRVLQANRLKKMKGSRGPKEVVMVFKEERTEARGKGMEFKHTLTVMSTRGSRFMALFGITKEKEKESWRVMGTLCPEVYETCLFTL